MSKWVILQLNSGRHGSSAGEKIFSVEAHREMWTPQTVKTVSTSGSYRSNFAFYGLGWNLTDVNGYLQVYHTGSHAGIETRVTMLPELSLGIIVFTNQQVPEAHEAITNSIIDGYLGIRGNDHIMKLREKVERAQAMARKITDEIWATVEEKRKESSPGPGTGSFAGTYSDAWFGDIIISAEDGRLRIRAEKSPRMRGRMFHYTANTFIVKWDDRSMDADAFAVFTLDREGKPVSFTMEAISPLTDFSYDFQDLCLVRREK
jgi:hypothetical protein